MNAASPAVHALARRVVDAETAGCADDEALSAALGLVFARLQEVTAAMVGELGYLSLLARAVRLTRARFPWLPVLPLAVAKLEAEFPCRGWQRYEAQANAAERAFCGTLL
ncbi:MAG: hypothetical protein JWN04_6684, partial [Myxococcaceae bacterium]|nr:hypothetical protein [Myxococcaceae bacterium]